MFLPVWSRCSVLHIFLEAVKSAWSFREACFQMTYASIELYAVGHNLQHPLQESGYCLSYAVQGQNMVPCHDPGITEQVIGGLVIHPLWDVETHHAADAVNE